MKAFVPTAYLLLAAVCAWPSGSFNGSTQYVGATNISMSVPITIHARIRPITLTGTQLPIGLGSPVDGQRYMAIGWTTFFGSIRWYCGVGDGTTDDYTTPTVTLAPSTNTFASATFVLSSATVRNGYLNGTNFYSGSGASCTPSLEIYSLGGLWYNPNGNPLGVYNFATCEVAEFAAWSVALDDGERAALDSGVSPLRVRPQSLVVHVPCVSTSFQAAAGPPNISSTVGTLADHPRIYR